MNRALGILGLLLLFSNFSGCRLSVILGSESDFGDSGEDAGFDAGRDAGPDAGEDAGLDAGPTGAPDAGFGKCGAGSELTTFVTYPYPNAYPYPDLRARTVFASADVDGDGILDLIEAQQVTDSGTAFSIWFGLGDGGLGSRTTYDTGFDAGFTGLAVGEAHGQVQILVWDQISGQLTLYLNDGGGGFNPAVTTYIPGYSGVAVGDVNGDGRTDLVAVSPDPEASGAFDLQIFLGRPNGRFLVPYQVAQTSGGPLAVGDLNGDGLADIIADTPDQENLLVLLSRGDGSFDAATYPTPAFWPILLLPNGTPSPDLVVGQSGLGFAVLHNRGDGTFGPAQTFAVVGYGLAVGDFNGDCIPDIATTASSDICEPGWGTSILYGDGDGGFGRLQFLPAPGGEPGGPHVLGSAKHPALIAIEDFCGDGGLTVYGGTSGP